MNESVLFVQEATVTQIPDGIPLVVPDGMRGFIMQILGGNFTLRLETGHLVRLDGQDAPAIGLEPPAESQVAAIDGDIEEHIWEQLRKCYDPEIPVNIVDLGLIYDLRVEPMADHYDVGIIMTLTAPGCGMGQVIADDVRDKVLQLSTVQNVNVEVVFDPPWNPGLMSEEAKLELGMF